MKNTLRKVLASTLALGLIIGSFAPSANAAVRKGFDPKKVGGTVTYSSFADAVRLTPYTTADSASNRLEAMMFDGLISTDQKGNPIPSVGTSWTISPDKKTYTFKMRQDVYFHDGVKLTARDVVFSFNIYMDKTSINPYKGSFNMIESVKALDNYTVQFKLNKVYAFFLYTAGAAILPQHQFHNGVKDFNDNNKIHRNPIGSGPFKFKEWRAGERVVLEANTRYWDGRPYLDRVIMKIVPDSNVEVINLLKNSVDFVESIAPKQVSTVKRNSNVNISKYDLAGFSFIGYNLTNPIFQDAGVRKALALGLDRKGIVDKILLKNAKLASGPFHPLTTLYNPAVAPLPYNVAEAKKLLENAGWKVGSSGYLEKEGKIFQIELSYNQGNKIREQVASIAAQQWKILGIKVVPRSYEWSIFLDKIDNAKLDAWILGWNLGTSGDQYSLWHSSQFGPDGLNSPRVSDPKVDKLLTDFRSELDPNKRAAIYKQVHQIMAEQQYELWLYYPQGFAGYNKKIQGIKFSLWNRFFNIEDWYIKK